MTLAQTAECGKRGGLRRGLDDVDRCDDLDRYKGDPLTARHEPPEGDVRRLARVLLRDQRLHQDAQQDCRAGARYAARLLYADAGRDDRVRDDVVLARARES